MQRRLNAIRGAGRVPAPTTGNEFLVVASATNLSPFTSLPPITFFFFPSSFCSYVTRVVRGTRDEIFIVYIYISSRRRGVISSLRFVDDSVDNVRCVKILGDPEEFTRR